MKRLVLILLSLVVIILVVSIVLTYHNHYTNVPFSSQPSGKPKALIRLHIHIPKISDSAICYVVARRFTTKFNPTLNGYTELIFKGKTKSGTTVTVESIMNMHQVGVLRNRSDSSYL